MMNPLVQRLKLYGFALVQVDPRRPINPYAWELPGLQAVVTGQHWKGLVSQCLPFSKLSEAPVLARSGAVLEKLRKRQPKRPLIWCQTAFEKPPQGTFWRKLLHSKPLPFVVSKDPGWPLLWVPPHPVNPPDLMMPYPLKHPLLKRLRVFQKTYPEHRFWLEEDGELALQYNLFEAHQPQLNGWQRELDRCEGAVLKDMTEKLQSPHLVVTHRAETLEMFRMDMVRWWGKRFCLQRGQIPEIQAAFGRLLVLVTDTELRWAAPAFRGWPVVHLGGSTWQRKYRMLRVSEPREPGWCSHETLLGEASLMGERGMMRFHRSSYGWHYSLVDRLLPRLDAALEEVAACFPGRNALNVKSRLR